MEIDGPYWIDKLDLQRHPEGGYFRETFRSDRCIRRDALSSEYDGDRSAQTAIYYLLSGDDRSKFHRLHSDEIWHFYAGSAITLYIILRDGKLQKIKLGSDPGNSEFPQAAINRGVWFGAKVDRRDSYALLGCTVAPGFEFNDFELASRDLLIKEYPEHRKIIEDLT